MRVGLGYDVHKLVEGRKNNDRNISFGRIFEYFFDNKED